ncbi:MAG: winged helix-turn-helix domain-containing protein [Nocardioidaceae bacterium]
MCTAQGVEIDAEARTARLDGVELQLTAKEFDLLHMLVRNAGRVVSRDELMHEVWDTTFWTSTKTIDVHVGWLRRKLGDRAEAPRYITTVRGQGLRFELRPPAGSDADSDPGRGRTNT